MFDGNSPRKAVKVLSIKIYYISVQENIAGLDATSTSSMLQMENLQIYFSVSLIMPFPHYSFSIGLYKTQQILRDLNWGYMKYLLSGPLSEFHYLGAYVSTLYDIYVLQTFTHLT